MPNRRLRLAALPILFGLHACTVAGLEPHAPTEAVLLDKDAALSNVNAFRAENGLKPLAIEPRLMQAAEAQSRAMAAKNDMNHNADGPLPGRIKRFGYRFSVASENIARGQPDFAAAMKGWIESPGHRRNLLDPKVTEIGFAAARSQTTGRRFWTQIFARPMAPAPAPSGLTVAGLPVPSR